MDFSWVSPCFFPMKQAGLCTPRKDQSRSLRSHPLPWKNPPGPTNFSRSCDAEPRGIEKVIHHRWKESQGLRGLEFGHQDHPVYIYIIHINKHTVHGEIKQESSRSKLWSNTGDWTWVNQQKEVHQVTDKKKQASGWEIESMYPPRNSHGSAGSVMPSWWSSTTTRQLTQCFWRVTSKADILGCPKFQTNHVRSGFAPEWVKSTLEPLGPT